MVHGVAFQEVLSKNTCGKLLTPAIGQGQTDMGHGGGMATIDTHVLCLFSGRR